MPKDVVAFHQAKFYNEAQLYVDVYAAHKRYHNAMPFPPDRPMAAFLRRSRSENDAGVPVD